jgi:hypothetical protein
MKERDLLSKNLIDKLRQSNLENKTLTRKITSMMKCMMNMVNCLNKEKNKSKVPSDRKSKRIRLVEINNSKMNKNVATMNKKLK